MIAEGGTSDMNTNAKQYGTSVTQNMSRVALLCDGVSLNRFPFYVPRVTFGFFESGNAFDHELSFNS